MSNLSALSRDTIEEWVMRADGPVFIDVWGPQCAPCIALAPTFDSLAARFGGRASFLKLEAPKNRMACVDLKVVGLPTFLYYEGGREIDRLGGDVDDDALRLFVEGALDGGESG